MHYPFWYVPGLTSPMWIAIVAVLHVYTALYAVGGSVILASQTSLAYRVRDGAYLEYLRNHTWFFMILTVIYGSLMGVGIWWTIGLASPLATEELIRIFVLGWAMEYVTFLIEILSIFIFFYYWGRLGEKDHIIVGWIYAAAAIGSLLIITPITAFQLNSGGWMTGDGFWKAFFNPQALPQIAARLGGSLLLGALYFFLHSTIKLSEDDPLRETVGRRSAKWAMLGAVLTIVGGVSWYVFLPPSAKAALVGASALNILMTIIFSLTVGVVLMMYFGPLRRPRWVSLGFAVLFFALGHAATGTGEFIREAVRKPYIVHGRVLGSQIRPEEIPNLRRSGYLAGGVWTSAYIKHRFPEVVRKGSPNSIDYDRIKAFPLAKRREIGRVVFQYHCGDCHAVEGYSAVSQLARGWDRELILYTVKHPERVRYFMPPWSGNDVEAECLTDYILSIRKPYPAGLYGAEKVK